MSSISFWESDLANWQEYARFFVGLIAMLNIAGNLPSFLSETANFSRQDKQKCTLVATLTVFTVLCIFATVGDVVLDIFGITIPSVRMAGGSILFLFGLKLLGIPASTGDPHKAAAGSPVAVGVSPIGMPLFAGPASISTVIVYAQIHEGYGHSAVVLLTILFTCAVLFAALHLVLAAGQRMNETTVMVISRIMGLIVASIAVAMVVQGIKDEFGLI